MLPCIAQMTVLPRQDRDAASHARHSQTATNVGVAMRPVTVFALLLLLAIIVIAGLVLAVQLLWVS